jgi:hypothetical protein
MYQENERKCKLHFEIVKEIEIVVIGAVIGVAVHQVTAASGNTVVAPAQFPSGILRRKESVWFLKFPKF